MWDKDCTSALEYTGIRAVHCRYQNFPGPRSGDTFWFIMKVVREDGTEIDALRIQDDGKPQSKTKTVRLFNRIMQRSEEKKRTVSCGIPRNDKRKHGT